MTDFRNEPTNQIGSYITDFLNEGINITPLNVDLEQEGMEAFEKLGQYFKLHNSAKAVGAIEQFAQNPDALSHVADSARRGVDTLQAYPSTFNRGQ